MGINIVGFIQPVFSTDPPSPYYNAFVDERIYDQRPCAALFAAKSHIRDGQYDEELVQGILHVLYSKKIQYLEERTFKTFDRELTDLRELVNRHQPSTGSKIMKLVGNVLSTATSTMTGLHEFLKPDGQLDLDKMAAALERKKRELVTNVNQEPITDLEIIYVVRKRFYPEALQQEIERTLLQARFSSFLPFNFIRDYLGRV